MSIAEGTPWLADDAAPGDTTITRRAAKPEKAAQRDAADGATAPRPRSHRYVLVKEVSYATVVYFNTRRLSAHNYEQILNELFGLVDREGHRRIVLNLTDVDYIYSTALASLTQFDSKVKEADGELRLCNLNPVLREVLEATNLDTLLDVRDDRRSALNAFW